MELPNVGFQFKVGRGKVATKEPEPTRSLGRSGEVPLYAQPVSEQFRTPEHLTTYPNEVIAARVARALEVAKLAAPLIRKGMPTEEACQRARDHLDWNEPLDVD